MQIEVSNGTRPPITLVDTEAEVLADLAVAALEKSTLGARLLLEEIDRASTIGAAEFPTDVVTMLSHVTFVDDATGEQHTVQLVYPKDADMTLNRVSVLTPIGAALIGMRPGASIDWPNRAGVYRRLRVVEVIQPDRQP